MGVRARIKQRLRSIKDHFTGEYSAAAPPPDRLQRYERPGRPVEDVHVVKARIQRPTDPTHGRRGTGATDDEQGTGSG